MSHSKKGSNIVIYSAMNTRTKIVSARFLSQCILGARRSVGLNNKVTVARAGIRWDIDLHEGIDLAIYLFRAFEPLTVWFYRRFIQADDVVIDIGANIGAHTLHLARCVGPQGSVIAFEPTDFAYGKLCKNIQLNPVLAPRIQPEQIMLSDSISGKPLPVYASWPLGGETNVHPVHFGERKNVEGARQTTLDAYLDEAGIRHVDFVKLDVDGNECAVLYGAKKMLQASRPKIILELAPYALEETGHSFEQLIELLLENQYHFISIPSGGSLPSDPALLRKYIPRAGSINVLATSS